MEEITKQAVLKAGGPTLLAQGLTRLGRSITKSAISQWKAVPADRVIHVETLTGISRHKLRPDIFGKSESRKALA